MKYKVGDKVKVISVSEHWASGRTIGKIGEIIKVNEEYNEYKVKIEHDYCYYYEKELEKVEEQNKFKKGDKVRVVKLEMEHRPEVKIGDIHIVESICNSGNIMTQRNVFRKSEIELFDENMKGEKTMKYKVGDKVKVRSDLKINSYYGNLFFDEEMEKFAGKICTIEIYNKLNDTYFLDCSSCRKFNAAMLEPVEEKNKFQKGDKVRVIKNGKCGIISNFLIPDYTEKGILTQNYKVEYIGNNLGDYDYYSCLELKLIERKEEILDEVEKRYLAAVIKPFKKYVDYIEKVGICSDNKEFIRICIKRKEGIFTSEEIIMLPNFKKETMYKNMKANKKYNLKELELL